MIDHTHIDDEMADLRNEIEAFRLEKERVRMIVGRVGGMPTFNTRLFNIVFTSFVAICLGVSMYYEWVEHNVTGLLMELAVAAISVKLIYLLDRDSRVSHFELWILSSLEWRLNEMVRDVKNIRDIVAPAADMVPKASDVTMNTVNGTVPSGPSTESLRGGT